MTLAGIEIRYLVNEISKKTLDYYVSNIYSITKDSVLFKLHHPEKHDVLLMFSTLGFWLSSRKIEQIEQNNLLKRLRNDLLRLKLTKIEQIGSERIVYLTFSGFDKKFILVGEFFGDGNIILCNKDMKILALLHSIDVRHRQLHVGMQYTTPPQNSVDIFNLNFNELNGIVSSPLPTAKWIGRTLGLPTKYAEHICMMSQIDPKTIGSDLTKEDIPRIYDSINQVVDKVVEGKHEPVIVINEKKSEVHPIKLDIINQNYTNVSTFIESLDKVFTERIVNAGKSLQSSPIDKKISEIKNRLDEQTKAISVVNQKAKTISNIAKNLFDLVTQGISSFYDEKVLEILKNQNAEILKEKGLTFIKIDDTKIRIEPNSPIPKIASILFDESKKQKEAIPSIEKLREKTDRELEKLYRKSDTVKESIVFSEVRKKNWYERYRWFFTSDGTLAIGGRDASSNSAVIRKHLESTDRVFHADVFGSPFFILKLDKKSPSLESLMEVAHATVCFSRAWRENMYGLSAFWVNPEQVKKGAPSGQFLSKGSFVIEGQRNYIKISSLKLAVGLLKQDGGFSVTCGPLSPIKKNCICYATIEPTGIEMADIAKKIKSKFLSLKEDIVKPINVDDFVRVLPAGKSHIVEAGLGEHPDGR